MTGKRKIEVFSAGCTVCEEAIDIVERAAGPSDEVIVHHMNDIRIAQRAKSFGIRSVPAVVIDGTVADSCSGHGVDEQALRAACRRLGPSKNWDGQQLAYEVLALHWVERRFPPRSLTPSALLRKCSLRASA
jgi:thioredoxin-like negative regulator of GroEL